MAAPMNIELLTSISGQNSTFALSNAKVAEGEDGMPLDARLAQVNLSQSLDNFCNVQVLTCSGSDFYLYAEWGRTGTRGSASLFDGPFSFREAMEGFDSFYKEKTGNDWVGRIVGGDASSPDKFQHLSTHFRDQPRPTQEPAIRWDFYLSNDHVLNGAKPDGWYAYDEKSGNEVEELYKDFQDNDRMFTRFVHSETSGYTYQINLKNFTQMNTSSRKVRSIRRSCGGVFTQGTATTTQKRKNVTSSSCGAAPKKKGPFTKISHKKSSAVVEVVEEVVSSSPQSPTMTLNLRQQYVKGLLSDRSARKYLKSISEGRRDRGKSYQ